MTSFSSWIIALLANAPFSLRSAPIGAYIRKSQTSRKEKGERNVREIEKANCSETKTRPKTEETEQGKVTEKEESERNSNR